MFSIKELSNSSNSNIHNFVLSKFECESFSMISGNLDSSHTSRRQAYSASSSISRFLKGYMYFSSSGRKKRRRSRRNGNFTCENENCLTFTGTSIKHLWKHRQYTCPQSTNTLVYKCPNTGCGYSTKRKDHYVRHIGICWH